MSHILRVLRVTSRWRPEGLRGTSLFEFAAARPNSHLITAAIGVAAGASALLWRLARAVRFTSIASDAHTALGTVGVGAASGLLLAFLMTEDANPIRRLWNGGRDRRALLSADEPRRLVPHRPRFAEGKLKHDQFGYVARQRNDVVELVVLRYKPVSPHAPVERPAGFGRRRFDISDVRVERVKGVEHVDGGAVRAELLEDAQRRETLALQSAEWALKAEREHRVRLTEAGGSARALRLP